MMQNSKRHLILGSLMTAVLAVAGCGSGDGGPAKYKVTGTVTFNGQNVSDGQIIFTPTENGMGPEAGFIKDGKYSVMSKGGKQKVSITASREVPGKTQSDFKGGTVPLLESYIPEKYNKNTELVAEVKNGSNSVDFKLTD